MWTTSYSKMNTDNTVSYIRKRPSLFFANARPGGLALASKLVVQAHLLGAQGVLTERLGDLYAIYFDVDWLSKRDSAIEIFEKLLTEPRLGQNSNFSEVLLTAFCEGYVVCIEGNILFKNMPVENEDFIEKFLDKSKSWKQSYLFRIK